MGEIQRSTIVTLVSDQDGRPERSRVYATDQRASAIELGFADRSLELQEENEKLGELVFELQSCFDAMDNCLIILDDNLRIESANRATTELLGYTHSELIGRELFGFFAPSERLANSSQAFADICCLKNRELLLQTRDGQSIPAIFSASLLPPTKMNRTRIVCVAYNLSEKKALEHQLLEAQKLESVGQLAAGIAHEINTPIQFVGDNTRFLQETFSEVLTLLDASLSNSGSPDSQTVANLDFDYLKKEVPLAIQQTLEGIERVSKIVRALKEFAHPTTGKKHTVDVNKLVQSTAIISTNEWKYVADMELRLDPNLPKVDCLPAELNRVFLNIIVNAAHAIQEKNVQNPAAKGKITITTSHNPRFVEIAIADTGGGIAKDIQQRIFDPFFTTKEVGRGSGQGLSLARSTIVDKHNGQILFHSVFGEGTTFFVRIPKESRGGAE